MLQRYSYLYNLAHKEARAGNIEYAAQIGKYLKELAKKAGVRLPRRIKRSLCKNCGLPLIPGVTARVRIRSQGCFSYKVVTCKRCGWIHRYPYKKVCRNGRNTKESSAEGTPQHTGRDNREEGSDRGGIGGDKEPVEEKRGNKS
jgi:ribonuclease P protein subunit RPR2